VKEPRVHSFKPDVPQGAPIYGGNGIARRGAGGLKRAKVVRHFQPRPPTAVEHILHAGGDEVRRYFLVRIVCGGRPGCAAPIAVLILIVILKEGHAAWPTRKHRTG